MKVNFRSCNIKKELFFGVDPNNIITDLDNVLRSKTLKEKRLQVSDAPLEYDIINDFISEDNYIKGSIMRLSAKNNILQFDDQIFNLEKINTSEITIHNLSSNFLVKDIYYFIITEKFVVLTIDKNNSLLKFQNYLNWLLKDISVTNYFINDRIVNQDNLSLSLKDVSKIRFIDPEISDKFDDGIDKNFIKSAKEKLVNLFNDSPDVNNLKLEHYFDMNLTLVPHKKSTNISSLSSLFKVITTNDNVEIITKDGKKINGSKLKDEVVEDIESENGNLDEYSVFLKLEEILKSLSENV